MAVVTGEMLGQIRQALEQSGAAPETVAMQFGVDVSAVVGAFNTAPPITGRARHVRMVSYDVTATHYRKSA